MPTVLIVDDDEDSRGLLEEGLAPRFQVRAVGSAEEALAAEAERFDVVLTDLWMPGMSGQELKGALDARGVAVPVILMSSDARVGAIATEAGFFDYLKKPFDLDQVEAALAGALKESGPSRVTPAIPSVAVAAEQTIDPGDEPGEL
jgi:DNA-binding NtrC family response regulator